MQKKLIALAIAGLSSAAFAQSNVTIYGQLRPSYDFVKVDGDETRSNTMSNNNSLIGFKGEEALGNGLKAIFQVESGVAIGADRSADAQGGTFGGRDTWAGFAGNFGSLTFGRHQSAYVRSTASYDNFDNSLGDYNNIIAIADGVDFNTRWSRSAYYTSPKWSGFQVLASYAIGENADGTRETKDRNVMSLAATYGIGALNLVAGYEEQELSRAGFGADIPGSAGTAAAAGAGDVKAWKLGANYKFGFGTTVRAIYENIESKSYYGAGDKLDRDAYYLSATHPITTNIDLNASYARAKEGSSGADDGAKNYNLGVNYKFSKRTSVQGIYSHLKNDTNGVYRFDSNGYGAADAKASGFSVRLSHNF